MKTVVITGATSGIGNLLVKEFLKQNCIVFAGYRNFKLKKELDKLSKNVISFYIDMSKKWSIDDAAKSICSKTDNINTLINAAGCVYAGPMECLSIDKIREQFEINTFSHIQFTQGLLGKFSGINDTKIINISSMSSFGIFPFVAPYCASKRALDILFNSMQVECGGKWKEKVSNENNDQSDIETDIHIKVISIKPGVMKTPLWEKSIENNKDVLGNNLKYEKEFKYLMSNAQKNANRGLDPQKVAELIVQIEGLEYPKSSYTIGADAKFAEILSHLPQDWINFIVKKSLATRLAIFSKITN